MNDFLNSHALQEYVVSLRRELHQHPELSMQEDWTCGRICEELSALGIPYELAGEKNVIGRIEFGPGKRLAIRADFDALPVQETVDVPWKSALENVMHACGHDGHTAALLGTAKALLSMKERLHGTVFLCFQQGEEVGQGADKCVEYLKAHGGVDMAIGAHLLSLLDTGAIDIGPGLRANGAGIFHIDITGKGGHGSRPDLVSNVLTIACDIYQHLIAIPSNRLEAARTCVVSPCVIQAGQRYNVLPETARLEGTFRFSGDGDGKLLMDMIQDTAERIAAIYGGSAKTSFEPMASYPVINDPAAAAIGQDAAMACGLRLLQLPPTSASDNFSEFLHVFPGFFCFVGSRSDREGTSGVHHASNFDFDETAMLHIVRFFCACAERILDKS